MKDFRETEKETDQLIEAKWRLELLRKQADRMKNKLQSKEANK